jgi:hypothetical protein
MMESGRHTILDVARMTVLSTWATKMAMVFEFSRPAHIGTHFSADDRQMLMRRLHAPEAVVIWVGRFHGPHIYCRYLVHSLARPHDLSPAALASTFVVGRFVVQVLAGGPDELSVWARHGGIQVRPGQWDDALVKVWPCETLAENWPPRLTFNVGGAEYLARRFATQSVPDSRPNG